MGPQEPETVYRVIEPKVKDNEGDNSVAMELIVLREEPGQSKEGCDLVALSRWVEWGFVVA